MTSNVVCKVMVPGEIPKSGTIIKECNSKKNLIGISTGKIIKKAIRESGIFRENTVNRSHAF